MAKMKFDGVVETAHFTPDGLVDWVRVYERRGPIFSDRLIMKREKLLEKIKAGKVYMVGQRIPLVASTFDVLWPIQLVKKNGKEYLSTSEDAANEDLLAGVPQI